MKGAGTIMLPLLAGAATGGAGFAIGGTMAAAMAGTGVGLSAMQGVVARQGSKAEAAQLERQREVEQLRGKERANEIREEMRRRIGAQRAALASRGVDPDGFGVGGAIIGETRRRGEKDLATSAMNTAVTRDSLTGRADQARRTGNAALLQGFVDAGMSAASGVATARRIGSVPRRGPALPPKRRPKGVFG